MKTSPKNTLSPEDIKELDRRWNNYKNGKSKTHTLEEAKKGIRTKISIQNEESHFATPQK